MSKTIEATKIVSVVQYQPCVILIFMDNGDIYRMTLAENYNKAKVEYELIDTFRPKGERE